MFCRLKVRSYVLAANVAGTLKVAPLQILKFPVVLPHKFLDAEKFNLRFSDASETVSYTHLDVYKRQRLGDRRLCSVTDFLNEEWQFDRADFASAKATTENGAEAVEIDLTDSGKTKLTEAHNKVCLLYTSRCV